MRRMIWAGVAAMLASGMTQAEPARLDPMTAVYELRTYYPAPGKAAALNARFREHTLGLFAKHGMTNVGYWVPQDAPAHDNTLVYIISHASREQAKVNWAEFSADPEWKKISEESQKDGKIVEKVESMFVDATDYSPIQ